MQCPICGKEMVIKKTETSYNSPASKEYDRTVYVCEVDDAWVRVEIPKKAS